MFWNLDLLPSSDQQIEV